MINMINQNCRQGLLCFQFVNPVLVSSCIPIRILSTSTIPALNIIENYYNYIEFRMGSMHIGMQACFFFYNDKYRLLPPTATDSDASLKTYVLAGHCLYLSATVLA